MALVQVSSPEVIAFIVEGARPCLHGHRLDIGAQGNHLRITRSAGDWFEAGFGFSVFDGSFHMRCVKRPLFLPEPMYMGKDLPGPGWLGRLRSTWSLQRSDLSNLQTALRVAIERHARESCYVTTTPSSFAASVDIPYRDDIGDGAEVLEASAYAYLLEGEVDECMKRLELIVAGNPEDDDTEGTVQRTRQMADLCRREPTADAPSSSNGEMTR